ncbi:glycosyltransferase family 2 protein [Flavobacterium sp. TAB 87]|uniref:glycosyltransferase family 2 protein n=1 Tax=Flavobacterium sp. TAB 87 TaxID=1729581 RepID=UPI00076BF779|nr:glycosyltransferase family 2 protein [Flavobacterium sp. TAB 87]KVV15891.1 transferase 2, rSAM/selenodomain-associated [Flavobacterium sp. TAB 87]
MKFSLIICTYMRPNSILDLLNSILSQTSYPDQILIIDGSTNDLTKVAVLKDDFRNLTYYAVPPQEKGLTKQRNFGISKVSQSSEIVCFLDDDTVLKSDYFEQVFQTYKIHPEALGVGGYITNETQWANVGKCYQPKINEFYFDDWKRADGSRFVLRKKLGLDSNCPPGYSSLFSHGRSVGFLPPTGKIYEVEQLMGGVSSFRKKVFDSIQFSTYFEGYGLYEDADFSLRIAKKGKLFLNTAAQLAHNHEPSGRPNQYQYGKMVVRNGWYVWRVKNPNPFIRDKFKWHTITILLTVIRFSNTFTTPNKKAAFTEALGRFVGWWSLFFNKPSSNE